MGAWLAAVVLPLFIVLAVLNMRRPTRLDIRVDAGQLIIHFRGWDAFYCLRRRLEVPVTAVEGVGVYDRTVIPAEGLRLPGTALPGVIRAGSYGTGPSRDFWDVRTGQRLLVIQLKPGAKYRRLVLEVPDPRQTMLDLRPVLGPLDWVPTVV